MQLGEGVHAVALPITVLNEAELSVMLNPAWDHDDFSVFMICSCDALPLAYCRLKANFAPSGMFAPHLDGSVQVVVPPGTTFHPWLSSRLLAAVTL